MHASSKRPLDDKENAAYCLTLPKRSCIYIQPLLAMKKFHLRDNKRGAVRTIYLLKKEGLGKVVQLDINVNDTLCVANSYLYDLLCYY